MAQSGPTSPAGDAETTSSPTPNDPSEFQPNIDPIASQWKQLAAKNRESPDFLPLLSSLTTGANRSSTTNLRGDNAKLTLGALDEVYRNGEIPNEYKRDILIAMRALAQDSGHVPPRYQVEPNALYVEDGVIARGASSEIRKGRLGGKTVAVKTLKIDRQIDPHNVQRFCKESIIWMNVSHSHLLQLIAVDIDPLTGRCSMISEMMLNGNIKNYVTRNPAVLNRLCLLHEAATGLQYLHECEIVHGDLKGHNILITNETPARACLADFGLSTLTPSASGEMTTITSGGTPLYMAPELFYPEKFGKAKSRPTQPADIYALGMVIYEVLTGLDPFYDQTFGPYEIVHHVLSGKRPTKPDAAENIGFGNGTWELVKECWGKIPTRRPTIGRVLAHLARVCAFSRVPGPIPKIPHNSGDNSVGTQSLLRLFRPIVATTRTHGFHIPYPGSEAILSHWNDLDSRLKDSKSIDHQLALLLDNAENRNIVKQFRGKDAAVVINTIDKVLKHNQVPDGARSRALELIRQLAGASYQVPRGYLISRWTRYTVKNEIIASGGFADVREGRLGGRVVAVKTIRTSRETNNEEIHRIFCKESVLWMNISHPNILQLLAIEVKPQTNRFSMIAELMTNGNITNYIRVNKANRLRLLKDVANGLQHLHNSGIIHGDLKGANILISNGTSPRACLADFGHSSIASIMGFDPTTRGGAGGTFGYVAPELYQRGAKPSKAADIYAFGMVVYEVITGASPFEQHILLEFPQITQGWRPPRPEGPVAMFDQGTWEFVEKCWDENGGQRPTAGEVLEHFECVAATSTFVDPVVETSSRLDRGSRSFPGHPARSEVPSGLNGPDSIFKYFSRLYTRPSTSSPTRIQQTAFTSHVLAGD